MTIFTLTGEADTRALSQFVAGLNDTLLRQASDCNIDSLPAIAVNDLHDNSFQRGFLMGVRSILECHGVPLFLSGEGVQTIMRRLNSIVTEFKVREFVESEKLLEGDSEAAVRARFIRDNQAKQARYAAGRKVWEAGLEIHDVKKECEA